MPQVEFDKKAAEIIDVELADKPPEYRKAVAEYVKLIPPRVRSGFSRPEDPTALAARLYRWRLETVRKKSRIKVELEQIPQLRDLFSGANLRKYRRHF